MSQIQTVKGQGTQVVNITKSVEATGHTLTKVRVGTGWDAPDSPINGSKMDLDISAAFLTKEGTCYKGIEGFLYWSSSKNAQGNLSVGDYAYHTGDNLTGEGDGEDESIRIDLTKVPAEVESIQFNVQIYEGANRGHDFGVVNGAFIRIADESVEEAQTIADQEKNLITTFEDLKYDASGATCIEVGRLLRRGANWFFEGSDPNTMATNKDLKALLASVGISV